MRLEPCRPRCDRIVFAAHPSRLASLAPQDEVACVAGFNCQTAAHKTCIIVPEISDGGRDVFPFLPLTNPRERSAAWRTLVTVPARRGVRPARRTRPTALHCGDFSPRPGAVHQAADDALASLIQAAYAALPPLP